MSQRTAVSWPALRKRRGTWQRKSHAAQALRSAIMTSMRPPRLPLGFKPADQKQDALRSSSQLSEPILRRRAGRCAEHGADLAREFDLAIGLMDQRDVGINPVVGR